MGEYKYMLSRLRFATRIENRKQIMHGASKENNQTTRNQTIYKRNLNSKAVFDHENKFFNDSFLSSLFFVLIFFTLFSSFIYPFVLF